MRNSPLDSVYDCDTEVSNNAPFNWDIDLRCPRCQADTAGVDCASCGFQMEIRDGIVYALPPERKSHYAKFIGEYESIRSAEGRGSQHEEYYLGLPYKDTTGNNSGQWRIRSRSYEHLIKHVLRPPVYQRTLLDLGAGNCWMSYRLALLGYSPIAVDLLTNKYDGLAAGSRFDKHLLNPIPRFQAELTCLPFRGGQFDTVVFNASFHYSEDYEMTLSEAIRCLKVGGQLIVSDSPWYSREESGRQMVAERHAAFLRRFGTASDSVKSLEYLTDERLSALEERLSIRWTMHTPWHGFKWAMRPWMAKLRGKREPSQFRIYVATKHG